MCWRHSLLKSARRTTPMSALSCWVMPSSSTQCPSFSSTSSQRLMKVRSRLLAFGTDLEPLQLSFLAISACKCRSHESEAIHVFSTADVGVLPLFITFLSTGSYAEGQQCNISSGERTKWPLHFLIWINGQSRSFSCKGPAAVKPEHDPHAQLAFTCCLAFMTSVLV